MKLIRDILGHLAANDASTAPAPRQPDEGGRDRRRSRRYAIGAPASLLTGDRRIPATVVDVSLSGIGLCLRFEPPHEHILHIELEVDDCWFSLTAHVVRSRFEGGLFRVGARFVDVSVGQIEHLLRFIEVYRGPRAA